jgi:transposase
MAGRKSSWKPARDGLPATRRALRPLTEVKDLRREAQALKEVVADLTLENRLLKKSMIGDGGDEA